MIISKEEAEEILRDEIGIFVQLKDKGNYMILKSEGKTRLSWIRGTPPTIEEDMVEVGFQLAAYDDKRKQVFPTIMDCIANVPTLEISSFKIQNTVTKGKPVKIERFQEFEGQQVILTANDHPLALGMILFGEFQPIIDVGWYLRAAEKQQS